VTEPTATTPREFVAAIKEPDKRLDSELLMALMARVSGASAQVWDGGILGFGEAGQPYRMGFAPRKRELVLHFPRGLNDALPILERLGKFKAGAGRLYIKRLVDIDLAVLRELLEAA